MAREAIPTLYLWKIIQGDLTVHLASSPKGALGVGLSMGKDDDNITDFLSRLPKARFVESYRRNRLLAAAATSVLQNGPPSPPPPVDIHLTPFQRQVLHAAARIPFGGTATYGQLAAQVGKPGAARAVGQVMHRNPLPLLFP